MASDQALITQTRDTTAELVRLANELADMGEIMLVDPKGDDAMIV